MFTVVGVTILLGIILYHIIFWDRINLPNPVAWPLFGNVLQIDPKGPHKTFDKWNKAYGGLYKIYRFSTPVVVVGSYEAAHALLVKQGKEFAGRPLFYRLQLWGDFQSWRDGLLFCAPDTTWKLLRISVQKHIKQFGVTGRAENVSKQLCQEMLDSFASHNGQPFDPKGCIMATELLNMLLFLLGRKCSRSDKIFQQLLEFDELATELLSVKSPHNLLDLLPWLKYFGNQTYQQFQLMLRKREVLFGQMKQVVIEKDTKRDGSVFETFMNLADEGQVEGGQTRVKLAIFNLILAGSSTTACHIHAFINIITHYRDIYKKLQKEVDTEIGTRPPTIEDRDKMPYMRAAIFELLRYSSIIPAAFHETLKDTHLNDTELRKGTEVLINLWSLHHDPSLWADPFQFKPERFLSDEGCLHSPDHVSRRRVLPFGAGPRGCVGENLAMGDLFLTMSSIIQRFEVEQPEPKVSCDPRDYRLAIVLTPPKFQVQMSLRNILT